MITAHLMVLGCNSYFNILESLINSIVQVMSVINANWTHKKWEKKSRARHNSGFNEHQIVVWHTLFVKLLEALVKKTSNHRLFFKIVISYINVCLEAFFYSSIFCGYFQSVTFEAFDWTWWIFVMMDCWGEFVSFFLVFFKWSMKFMPFMIHRPCNVFY